MGLLAKAGAIFGTKNHISKHHQEMLRSLLVMAWIVEARDPYTGGHLWRVSRLARLLSIHMGLSHREVARISLGGFLHDLGKVGIPDQILNKKDRLTDDEYAVIKTHPDVGWRMLSGHPLAELVEAAVRSHHETPDGKGYPQGLEGNQVPLDARIVGICDAFDAMTSSRPYRQGMEIDKALNIIQDNLGRQFDPILGEQFISLNRHDTLRHIVGHSDEGIPLHDCVMCGPTLVIRKGQNAGDYIYCRSCTGEYITEYEDGKLISKPTGKMGQPKDLEPDVDNALIGRLVLESAHAL